MGGHQQKEWRKGRSALFGALAEGLALAGAAFYILLHLGSQSVIEPPPGYWLIALILGTLATVIVRRVPNFWMQVLLFAIPIIGLVLFFRGRASMDRELNALAAVALLAWAGFRFATAWRRVRTPLFLRLGPEGIERGGYALATPTIPYGEIARVEPHPDKNSKSVFLVLRHREGWRDRLLNRVQGYDVKLGADVGAPPVVLAALIRREIPEISGEIGHSGFLTTFPYPD